MFERLEHLGIEDFGSVRAIEARDERILIGFARLNTQYLNALILTPGHKPVGGHTIIESSRVRQ